jgi:hypothetical protein
MRVSRRIWARQCAEHVDTWEADGLLGLLEELDAAGE